MTNQNDPQEQSAALRRLIQTVALATRPWVVVVGAGLSSPNISNWGQLHDLLLAELEAKTSVSDEDMNRLFPYVEKLEDESLSYWERFGILKEAIPVEYRNIIRHEFAKSDSTAIPPTYTTLWSLPLRGVLSLNLDSYARRAAMRAPQDSEIKIFDGKNAGRLQRMLISPHRFLYQLHGNADDEDSWIFSRKELEELYSHRGYEDFLKTVFTQFHVVFVGVTADDIAIGAPLERLAASGIQGPDHYWITDRTDDDAARWAAAAKVEIVSYASGKHDQVHAYLRQLSKARAVEPIAPPVALEDSQYRQTIPNPGDLASYSTENIRIILNGHAKYLLAQDDFARYESFLNEYDELIDRSWYVPRLAADYKIFDYVLSEHSAKGAFGSVYRATDAQGHEIALKLLKREIRNDAASIYAFRRGVQAMKILNDRRVDGMVAYRDASEIPALVTMDWVDGPNLKTAKEARLIEGWHAILDVFIKATRIVSRAHRLPEQVLHRDIRPANIMLRDGWTTTDDFDVVVLDFDLATYSGAKTESVIAEGSALGYLAPEQLRSSGGSRSAYVDSFGLGMTLYYLVGREEPDSYFHRDARFEDHVRRASREPGDAALLCTPQRVERLIINSTREAQKDRWSIDLILAEASRLQAANLTRLHPLDGDLAAEEIAANTPALREKYRWDNATDSAVYTLAGGPRVRVQGTVNSFDVLLEVEWADDGTNSRSKIVKYLPERSANASSVLSRAGWEVRKTMSNRQMTLSGVMRVETDTDYAKLGAALSTALEELTFD